jgi:hypothetical protein
MEYTPNHTPDEIENSAPVAVSENLSELVADEALYKEITYTLKEDQVDTSKRRAAVSNADTSSADTIKDDKRSPRC